MASKKHLSGHTYYIWSNHNKFPKASATLIRLGLENSLREEIQKNGNKVPPKNSLFCVGVSIFEITEITKKSRGFFKKSEYTISVSFVAVNKEKLERIANE